MWTYELWTVYFGVLPTTQLGGRKARSLAGGYVEFLDAPSPWTTPCRFMEPTRAVEPAHMSTLLCCGAAN